MIEYLVCMRRGNNMKILQINANYGFGSTGLIVKDIGEEIIRSGNEAYFAYQRSNTIINNGFVVGNVFDWKIHAILCRIFGGQGYYSRIVTNRFIKKIKKIKPDVVHLHNLHSNFINIDILFTFLAKKDIPTVITMHDCWYFTGKCFHYVDYGCKRYTKECGNCPKKKNPPKSFLFDWSRKSLKNKKKKICSIPRLRLVGCSKWVCEEAKKGIFSNCKIETIYNGVDISIFKPRKNFVRRNNNINDAFLVMGMANKWLLDENADMLQLVSSLSGVCLMIVGCTDDQKKKIKKINKDIVTIGFINNRKELAEYYSAADVFVNLTHADTLPTVNMESICCGTPVITYDSCGSPELVNGLTGKIVEENNKEGILEAIKYIHENRFDECRSVGEKKFNKINCYKRYIEIYEELVNKRK